MSPWIPVIISCAVALVGVIGNAVVVAFFLGKMRERQSGQEMLVAAFQDFSKQTVSALLTRMHTLDEFASTSSADRAALNARLLAVERNTDGLQALREQVAGFHASYVESTKRSEADSQRMSIAIESLQRQLGNLVSGRAGGVTTITRDGGG